MTGEDPVPDREQREGASPAQSEVAHSAPDPAFEALLREAARGSAPVAAASTSPLTAGATLCADRLRIVKKLGEGGMGVVYEAFDAQRKQAVALKTLSRLDASGVYRLKNEFRALADVQHANLVRLHELFNDGALWCFTMELVAGERFDTWVRPDGALDEARLRAALVQLIDAVGAVHAAGKLHRDLKPSNVLVTSEGRVVVLDFGLAVTHEGGGAGQTVVDDGVSGTPAYMAPEQAGGGRVSAASDLYALGVMLFEALTGRLPFAGRSHDMVVDKQRSAAPSVHSLVAEAPADLAALCDALLSREADARPTLEHLRLAFDVGDPERDSSRRSTDSARSGAGSTRDTMAPAPQLEGRESELAALRDAFEATQGGQAVVVFVSGESGMGKSALCEGFMYGLRAERQATVLSGRCYERENVPFKGFDSLIDDLSRHLRRLPREEAIAVLPRDVHALSRLFPVLGRVDVVASAPKREFADPQELRRRAYAALGELMTRMCDRAPLCIHLDDVQWLDTDAVLLLRALTVHPEPMPALFLLSHRSEGADTNQALLRVRDAIEGNSRLQLRVVGVGPLSVDASRKLALRLLPAAGQDDGSAAAAIAREAGGSPFFVGELSRFVVRRGGDTAGLSELSLQVALSDHQRGLSSPARRLLECSALAGKPLPADLLMHAAEAEHADLDAVRASHLLRMSRLESSPIVECYHDKVREAVAGGLSELQRVATYATLAAALESHAYGDHELLATCFEGAGQRSRAADFCVVAAEQAMSAMAFLLAAELYHRALTLGTWTEIRGRELLVAHGEALQHAGRGKQAAEAFLRVAQGVSQEEGSDLRRRAAEQLLTTGHTEQGTALFRALFDELGLTLPKGPDAAMRRILVSQIRLRVRGLSFSDKRDAVVALATRQRLDTLLSAITGIAPNATLVAASLGDDYLLRALGAGAPEHLCQAFGFQAHFLSFALPAEAKRIVHLHDTALRIATELGDPGLIGRIEMLAGTAYVNRGLWARGQEHEARAFELLRQVSGRDWEVDITNVYDQIAAFQVGDFPGIARTTPQLIEQGLSRDRVWVATMLSGQLGAPAWLCSDDVSGYQRVLETVHARWKPRADAQWPDYFVTLSKVALALYRGEWAAALSNVERDWSWIDRSLLRRPQMPRSIALMNRGTAALGVLRLTGDRVAEAVVRDCVRILTRIDLPYAAGYRAVLLAGLALHVADRERGALHLQAAIRVFDEHDMALYAAAARRRLGELLGGDDGKTLRDQADAAMRARGVVNLEATTEMLCAGCRAP